MRPRYPTVSQRATHRCEYCHAPEAIYNSAFEVEHIVPLSQEGADDESNLALACRSCNLHKAAYLVGTDETTETTVRLFHPRQDRWEEHFEVDTEAGIVTGLTPVGRATVVRLRMNSVLQLAARRLWMRLGLFP